MGIDDIINRLRDKIGTLSYVQKSYGRAMVFKENIVGKGLVSYPKVLLPNGDYANPLPNDQYTSQSFFIADGRETYKEFDRVQIGEVYRQFSVIWWGDVTSNTLEQVKFDYIKILQKDGSVKQIDSYIDEQYHLIFPEFTTWITRSTAKDTEKKEANTNWLMYPNSGFRLTFTIAYIQPC